MSARSDAASDRVSYTAAAPPDPATAFTAVFWARLRVNRSDFSTMIRLHSSSGGNTAANIATGSSGTTPAVFSPTGSTLAGADALAVDTWRKVAVTCAGTGAADGKIYTATVAGDTHVASGQISGGAAPDAVTLFGRDAGNATEWFNGGLALVRIWAAVLTPTEIETEWASTTAVKTLLLWANWPLISDLNDVSGNGRHLVAGTTPLDYEDDPPISVPSGVKIWTGSAWTNTPPPRRHDGAAWQTTPAARPIGT